MKYFTKPEYLGGFGIVYYTLDCSKLDIIQEPITDAMYSMTQDDYDFIRGFEEVDNKTFLNMINQNCTKEEVDAFHKKFDSLYGQKQEWTPSGA